MTDLLNGIDDWVEEGCRLDAPFAKRVEKELDPGWQGRQQRNEMLSKAEAAASKISRVSRTDAWLSSSLLRFLLVSGCSGLQSFARLRC